MHNKCMGLYGNLAPFCRSILVFCGKYSSASITLYFFLGIVQLSCNRRVITVQSCSSVFCDLEFIGQIVCPCAVTLG